MLLDRAVERFARATADMLTMTSKGYEPLIHQQVSLDTAAKALDALQPEAPQDLRRAFAETPMLIDDAAKGKTSAAIRAMQLEAEIRIDTGQRADRFVTEWRQQVERYRGLRRAGDTDAADRARSGMMGMVKSAERDPQLESLLKTRRIELGLKGGGGASLSHEHHRSNRRRHTAAFEELRREVSLTRAAVEGLTATRERIPDYSTTLGRLPNGSKSPY